MANQNFRVKNGINVGTAVTITTSEYQVGSTRIHSSGVETRSITVTDNAGISTVPQLKLTGRLYDANNNVGTGTSVLVSTGIGVSWIPIATAALQGVQGTQGITGVQGTTGTQGTTGIQGATGTQGTTGTQGATGTQGTTGTQGATGTQGTTGTQGATGPSTTINATAVTTNSTFYPVFVAAAGSNQTASVRTTATAFTFNASTGDLTVGGTVTASSDESIKTNIQTIKNALDKVSQLRGVEFNYKETGKHSIGFIAQEVEQIIPDLVFGNDPKSIAYQNFVALLVEAIKELLERVEKLENS